MQSQVGEIDVEEELRKGRQKYEPLSPAIENDVPRNGRNIFTTWNAVHVNSGSDNSGEGALDIYDAF
jgi:hypothetical protein